MDLAVPTARGGPFQKEVYEQPAVAQGNIWFKRKRGRQRTSIYAEVSLAVYHVIDLILLVTGPWPLVWPF